MINRKEDGENNEVLLMCVSFTCWNIWKERCEVVIKKREVRTIAMVGRIEAVLKEYIGFMEKDEKSNGQKITEAGKGLENGWMKINCDGSFVKQKGAAGVRVVVKNGNGCLIDGVCEEVLADSPLVVEALVVKKGIKLALDKGY